MNGLSKMYSKCIKRLDADKENVSRDYWRLGYHLMPPTGWLNDPNGLCEYNGTYHVHYQYSPFEAEGGLKFWGHYSSEDFINWKDNDVSIYPDQPFDCHGVFSGTAFIEDDISFFYTGTVIREGYEDLEMEGMEQNTVLVTSKDGVNFSKKNLLLTNDQYPSNMSWHVRDPKVWKFEDNYYMILGAKTLDKEGCALIYTSKNKVNWTYINTITSKEKFGYMWECPDYFTLENKDILITCPQGVELDGEELVNIHQCGYFIVDGDITTNNYNLSKFNILDRGFDFYAPQTFKDSKGRRILIGWLSISDTPFEHPTIDNGWQHCLSLPRELKIKNGKITQSVLKEIKKLRYNPISFMINNNIDKCIKGDKFELEINLDSTPDELEITLRNDIKLIFLKYDSLFRLQIGQCGYGRDERKVKLTKLENLRIFSDTSSLEIFINDGEEVFTTRVYPKESDVSIEMNGKNMLGNGVIYSLNNIKLI